MLSSMKPIGAHIRAFRRAGRRIAPQRRLIFQILAGEAEHPTAQQVFRRAVTAMWVVSRSTEYHTLNTLVELGDLNEIWAPAATAPIMTPISPGTTTFTV